MHEKTCERRYARESMQEDGMCETVRLAVRLAAYFAVRIAAYFAVRIAAYFAVRLAMCLAACFAACLAACFAGRYDLGNTDQVRDGAANKQELCINGEVYV